MFVGEIISTSILFHKYSLPDKRLYNALTIYGNCGIDKLQVKDYEMTNEELLNFDITKAMTMDAHTLLQVGFENNLNGGSIKNLVSPLTKWVLYRQEVGSDSMIKLDDINVNVNEYIDYKVASNKQYEYFVFPETENEIGSALKTDIIDVDFYGCYLIGIENNITYSYLLDLDLDFSGFKNDEDFTEYQTYNKYNAFNFGKRNFKRGTINVIAGTISDEGNLIQPVDYIDKLKDRLKNNSPKILKTRKGDVLQVITHNVDIKPVNNSIKEQPYIVSFEFIECGDIS